MKDPQMPNQTYPRENDPRDLPARDPAAFQAYLMLPSSQTHNPSSRERKIFITYKKTSKFLVGAAYFGGHYPATRERGTGKI